MLQKIARTFLIIIFCFLAFVAIVFVTLLEPVDRRVDRRVMQAQVDDSIDSLGSPQRSKFDINVGYSKISITPDHPTATAGYSKRRGQLFTAVHDSIYVRTLIVDNGVEKVAIVSADLLIIPPEVTARLNQELTGTGFSLSNVFMGAIHSHNSMGNWSKGATGIIYGDYDEEVVSLITRSIRLGIGEASARMSKASIRSGAIPVKASVINRIDSQHPVDSMLRCIEIRRADSTRLLLMNFTAHATCLFSKDLELSRDYPGALVDTIEKQGYQFAMFMAGAVGSHRGNVRVQGWPCVDEMSAMISTAFQEQSDELKAETDNIVWMRKVNLPLGEPQAKAFFNWRLRSWLFNEVLGDYPEFLTVLRLGNVVMVGTPCDYSGEFYHSIDSLAASNHVSAMITSFNGGYIGYVTPTRYFDRNHYETQLMNWYGPGNAEYIEACIEKLIVKAAASAREGK